MKVLAHVHGYPPTHNAGAEWMLHTMLRDLARKGHEVTVLTGAGRLGWFYGGYFEGVLIRAEGSAERILRHYQWADVVVTHLDRTQEACENALATERPLVHIVHNPWTLQRWGVDPTRTAAVVFNSKWLQAEVAWPGHQVVIPPPVTPEDYRVEPAGDCITLLNCNQNKGAPLFYELARRMPDHRFLGVLGAYEHQVWPEAPLRNLQLLHHTQDPRWVYSLTRVLVMPSAFESWGRTAIEAASSGIPTVAHPTPGLQEALGSSGIFCDRDDPEAWVAALRALDDQGHYCQCSEKARKRSCELDPRPDLDRFERLLEEVRR